MSHMFVLVQCWAALGAFRAAEPARFADETGIDPNDHGLAADRWRLGCRTGGSLLLTGAALLSIHAAGLFEGAIFAAAASMFAAVGVILLAPVARRLVWGTAALSLAVTPIGVAFILVYGGTHGAG